MARFFNNPNGGTSTDYLFFRNYGNLNTTDISLSCWLTLTTAAYAGWIFSMTVSGSINYGFLVRQNGNVNYGIELTRHGTSGDGARFTNDLITPNVWTHLVCTCPNSATGANYHIYLNGVEATYVTSSNRTGTNSGYTGNWIIGSDGNPAHGHIGNLAELAVYNRILTASEIQFLYLNSTPTYIPNLMFYVPLTNQSFQFEVKKKLPPTTRAGLLPVSPPFIKRLDLFDDFDDLASADKIATTVKFRKTLSGIGTKVGSRQVHSWGH